MREQYKYATVDEYDLSNTGTIVELECRGRRVVTIEAEATVNSKFSVEVDMGDGDWVEHDPIDNRQEVAQSYQLTAAKVRLTNPDEEPGETVDAKLGCA